MRSMSQSIALRYRNVRYLCRDRRVRPSTGVVHHLIETFEASRGKGPSISPSNTAFRAPARRGRLLRSRCLLLAVTSTTYDRNLSFGLHHTLGPSRTERTKVDAANSGLGGRRAATSELHRGFVGSVTLPVYGARHHRYIENVRRGPRTRSRLLVYRVTFILARDGRGDDQQRHATRHSSCRVQIVPTRY